MIARSRPALRAGPRALSGRLGGRRVGANDRLRCYRYAAGQRFAPHYDGSFSARRGAEPAHGARLPERGLHRRRDGGEIDCDGAITSRTGLALLFQHAIFHEGARVTAGVKYVVRSDIMYRARP